MLHQYINRGLALLFIWAVGFGFATYIIATIEETDFSYMYTGSTFEAPVGTSTPQGVR